MNLYEPTRTSLEVGVVVGGYNFAKGNLADARSQAGKERRKVELDKSRDELVDTFVEALTNLF